VLALRPERCAAAGVERQVAARGRLRTLGLLRQRRCRLSRPESPVHRLRLGCRHGTLGAEAVSGGRVAETITIHARRSGGDAHTASDLLPVLCAQAIRDCRRVRVAISGSMTLPNCSPKWHAQTEFVTSSLVCSTWGRRCPPALGREPFPLLQGHAVAKLAMEASRRHYLH
jgi:hypothetical protein